MNFWNILAKEKSVKLSNLQSQNIELRSANELTMN